MKGKSPAGKKWMVITVSALAVLALVVIVQSVFLVRMSNRMSEISGAGFGTVENAGLMGGQWQTKTVSSSQKKKADPMNMDTLPDWFDRPFDKDTWDPFREMQQMREYMDRMFDSSMSRFGLSPKFGILVKDYGFSPRLDVTEESKRFVITVDLPGVNDGNVNVTVSNDRLVKISGVREKEIEKSDAKGNIIRRELRKGKFERSVMLPEAVDADGMKVEHKKGVLTIYLPKKNQK